MRARFLPKDPTKHTKNMLAIDMAQKEYEGLGLVAKRGHGLGQPPQKNNGTVLSLHIVPRKVTRNLGV